VATTDKTELLSIVENVRSLNVIEDGWFSDNNVFLVPSLPPLDPFMVLEITHFRDFGGGGGPEGRVLRNFSKIIIYVNKQDSSKRLVSFSVAFMPIKQASLLSCIFCGLYLILNLKFKLIIYFSEERVLISN